MKFEDIFVTKNAKGKDCVRITYNVVKGKEKHACIKKNIVVNERDEDMRFINASKSYLQSEYGINIKDFNSIRNLKIKISGTFQIKISKIWNVMHARLPGTQSDSFRLILFVLVLCVICS